MMRRSSCPTRESSADEETRRSRTLSMRNRAARSSLREKAFAFLAPFLTAQELFEAPGPIPAASRSSMMSGGMFFAHPP